MILYPEHSSIIDTEYAIYAIINYISITTKRKNVFRLKVGGQLKNIKSDCITMLPKLKNNLLFLGNKILVQANYELKWFKLFMKVI